MGNNPISNVDPLGDFKTRFGAWWHSLWNGGDVGENKFGEYYVTKSYDGGDEKGPTVSITYGKGRDKYSNAKEAAVRDLEIMQDIQRNGENSLYKMYDSPEDAGKATVGYVGLAIPSPLLETGTVGANAGKTVVEATTTASTGTKALAPSVPNLTQEVLEHIISRHWGTSGAKAAGKFAQGITGTSLKEMIKIAANKGIFRANTGGRAGTIAEYNFGQVIGTTSKGTAATNLRVVIGTNGNVITAFPF
jgi:hypothetical protein